MIINQDRDIGWLYNTGVLLDSLSLHFNDVASEWSLEVVWFFGAAW